MSENINIQVIDAEVDATIAKLDVAISKSQMLLAGSTGVGGLTTQVQKIKKLKGEADKILLGSGVLSETGLLFRRISTLARAQEKYSDFVKTLPRIDRATRMILLRLPGLREASRILFGLRMEERTLRLGDLRGPITAALTLSIYLFMTVQSLQAWKERQEAHQEALEREMNHRLLTMEEALRGYGALPERYRSTVVS